VTFGPRPGDVERVESLGAAAYLDQQLHPERLDDSALESRLTAFPTLTMSTQELAEQYFLPAQQLRRNLQVRQQKAEARTARSTAGPSMAPAAAAAGSDAGSDPAAAAPAAPQDGTAASGRAALPPEVRQAQAAQQAVLSDLMQSRVLRDALSERQLQEVLVDFWFNHFNVFVGKGQVREFLTEYERDAIRPHVLGRFRDLLGAVAHSPAMLFYLDNWQSSAPEAPAGTPGLQVRSLRGRQAAGRAQLLARVRGQNAPQKRATRGLNENYARELMELHTLGVDGGYTQQDVIALARILTGWTIDRPAQGGGFIFRPAMHDQGTKTLLGVTFTADGENEGERALDLLARQPATAHHIAYELCERFVSDTPPATLVDRAAKRFLDTRGDLREVMRTILTSPEFFDAAAYHAKVKTPLEFVISSVRATGATIVSAQPLVAALRNLGMPLYGCQPPTGYSMTADAWINTGALINRMNFAVQLVSGGRVAPQQRTGRGGVARRVADGAPANPERRGLPAAGPVRVDLSTFAADTSNSSRDHVIDLILGGDASSATTATLARAQTPTELVALALGSPEFQRR
jgi:uncharacterized protein (DUF1800 family)